MAYILSMGEEELVQELKAGNQKAFQKLVSQYQDKVLATSMGYVHNLEEAEDLAQEVFIQVFKKINQFRGDAKLSTWIYRITVNRSLNKLRSMKRSFFQSLDELISADTYNNTVHIKTPIDNLEDSERADVLHEAIDKLPVNQKTAFILSKYDGLPNKEIAIVMDTSLSAVEALMNRAKKNLQQQLVSYYKNN